jgi:hypothetical protein
MIILKKDFLAMKIVVTQNQKMKVALQNLTGNGVIKMMKTFTLLLIPEEI